MTWLRNLFRRSSPPELISVVAVTGDDGQYIKRRRVCIGLKGEKDLQGQQRWYDSLETLKRYHPEVGL